MEYDKYYKNKYLIALYDDEDYPFVVVSTVKELSEATGKSTDSLHSILSRGNKRIYVKGNLYHIYLIPIEEED